MSNTKALAIRIVGNMRRRDQCGLVGLYEVDLCACDATDHIRAISPITGWESVPYGLSTSGGGGGGGGGGAELPTTGLSPPGSPLSTSVGAGGEHIHSSQLHSSEHGNNAFFSIDGGESNPSQVPAEAALTPL